MQVLPMGARLKVRVLSMELRTDGGIILPASVMPGKDDAGQAVKEAAAGALPTLQLVEVLEVGEGQYDPTAGVYRGSRFKKGEILLMRCGPTAQLHLDLVPVAVGGKNDEVLIQETLVAGRVEGFVKPSTVRAA
jgi:co-chaperonin GroES (HSP10)